VVLPFTNLSGDPSQDYFADGVTENLTTEPLAHPPATPPSRFETEMADLFKLQDQVVAQLANALRYELGMAEEAKASNAQNPDAVDLAMRGLALLPLSLPSKDQVDAGRHIPGNLTVGGNLTVLGFGNS
jgi:hypothetical protein